MMISELRVRQYHNEKNIDLIIRNLREATNDELSDRSYKAVVRKVVDKYNQGKVNSFRDYLVTALANKIDELELRRNKAEEKQSLHETKKLGNNKEKVCLKM